MTNTAIFNITGVRPVIHRVPFGAFDDLVIDISRELGMALIQWNFDPLDWRYRDADIIYKTIMSNVRHGDIIVLHDIHGSTIDAMERVIPALIEAGFKLVTVSQLLGEIEPGAVYRAG
jgi:peptidoglycan/xylan/chitin deacetylase (PgdA/CDA1 family)